MSDVAIPDGWQQVKLGDVCEVVMGQSPPGDTVERFPTGKPLLNGPTEFTDRSPIPAQWTKRITKVAPQGSLLFCVRGSTTGKMNWADQEYVIGRGIGAIWHKSQGSLAPIVRAWIEYQLPHLLNIATGSTFPNVSRDQLTNLSILLPPIQEQKAIAHILGTLDDKIDQLRKTNSVLEDMASALFKSWFVDFDPVKAKQENRPTGLPKELDDLFPDSFEDSALGPIPTGWRVGTLSDITGSVIGGDWGKSLPSETEQTRCYCIRGADIPDLQLGLLPNLPLRYLKQSSITKRKLEHGDIVLEISGGSPTQSTGRPVLIVDQLRVVYDAPLVTSNFCRIIKFKSPRYSFYAYQWLRFLYVTDVLYQFETGTTGIKNFGYTIFSTIQPLLIPNDAAIFAFEEYLSRKFARTVSVANQIRTLTNLRDTLLPKLISGDLRVPEAEQMVAELGL